MVTVEEFINLGFRPYNKSDYGSQAFIITNRSENPFNPWRELMVIYDFEKGIATVLFTDSEKDATKRELWRGPVSSIEQLEEKLIELNGEY